METEYKGFVIKFNEWNETWDATLDGHSAYSKPSLKAVKESIDKQLKSDFKRITAFMDSWGKGFTKGTITSIDEDGINVWFTKECGDRGKEVLDYLYADTCENALIIEQISSTNKQIKELEKTVSELKNNMQKVVL